MCRVNTETSKGLSLRKKYQFTLVELLVVIAIISILAGMLLPALENAIDSARSIQCSSNMKQTNLFLLGYTNDHNDILPLNENDYDGRKYWHWTLAENGYLPEFTYSNSAPPEGVLACPDAVSGGYLPDGTTQKKANDYGKNMFTGYRRTFFKLSQASTPSGTYFIGDTGGSSGKFPHNMWSNQSYPDLRHNNEKSWNCLFIDGHVEHLNYYDLEFWSSTWCLLTSQFDPSSWYPD
jgi:prepilin-type N-terminal cleavage/methylation domain-containing protein/prepilin-type processing-associated H-X9-DG protein